MYDEEVDHEIEGRDGSFLPDSHRGPSEEVDLAQRTAHQDMHAVWNAPGSTLKPQVPGALGMLAGMGH